MTSLRGKLGSAACFSSVKSLKKQGGLRTRKSRAVFLNRYLGFDKGRLFTGTSAIEITFVLSETLPASC